MFRERGPFPRFLSWWDDWCGPGSSSTSLWNDPHTWLSPLRLTVPPKHIFHKEALEPSQRIQNIAAHVQRTYSASPSLFWSALLRPPRHGVREHIFQHIPVRTKTGKNVMAHPDFTFKTKPQSARGSRARCYIQRLGNNWVNDRFLWGELHKRDNGINWDGVRAISWCYSHTTVWVSLGRAHARPEQPRCWTAAASFFPTGLERTTSLLCCCKPRGGYAALLLACSNRLRIRCVSHRLIGRSLWSFRTAFEGHEWLSTSAWTGMVHLGGFHSTPSTVLHCVTTDGC